MAFYDRISNFFEKKEKANDVNNEFLEEKETDNSTISTQPFVSNSAVDKLYMDLNFCDGGSSDLDYVTYCNQVMPLLSEEIVDRYEEQNGDINYRCVGDVLRVADVIERTINYNDNFNCKIFCDGIRVSERNFRDDIKNNKINEIKDDILREIVNENVTRSSIAEISIGDEFKKIDSNLVKDQLICYWHDPHWKYKENCDVFNLPNMDAKTIETGIKKHLNNFLEGLKTNDDALIKESINKAFAISYFAHQASKTWYTYKALPLLHEEYNKNYVEKRHLVSQHIRNEELLEEAKNSLANDYKKLDDINVQLVTKLPIRDKEEFSNAFKDYCEGRNPEFPKMLRLETPIQVKLLNDYNNTVDKINRVYKQYELAENKEELNKKLDKQAKYNFLSNKYSSVKKDDVQQDLNR